VNLFAKLVDYGAERQSVVIGAGSQLGVEPIADRGGRATVSVE
jgi:hypothetical protein